MMPGFIKKYVFTAMKFFSFIGIAFNQLDVNSLECVSMNNQICKITSEIRNVNDSSFISIVLQ